MGSLFIMIQMIIEAVSQPLTAPALHSLVSGHHSSILTFVIHSLPIRTIDCPNLEMVSENYVGVGITDKIYEL